MNWELFLVCFLFHYFHTFRLFFSLCLRSFSHPSLTFVFSAACHLPLPFYSSLNPITRVFLRVRWPQRFLIFVSASVFNSRRLSVRRGTDAQTHTERGHQGGVLTIHISLIWQPGTMLFDMWVRVCLCDVHPSLLMRADKAYGACVHSPCALCVCVDMLKYICVCVCELHRTGHKWNNSGERRASVCVCLKQILAQRTHSVRKTDGWCQAFHDCEV